jgi:hypothetical protein
MNWALILLILIVLVGIVMVIIYQTLSLKKYRNQKEQLIADQTTCSPALNTLEDLSNLYCCNIGGLPTNTRYWDKIDMIVAPTAIPYLEACSGFCAEGVGGAGNCNEGIGQNEYNRCIELLRPKGCRGLSQPVAKIGITYYYGRSAGSSACNPYYCRP